MGFLCLFFDWHDTAALTSGDIKQMFHVVFVIKVHLLVSDLFEQLKTLLWTTLKS